MKQPVSILIVDDDEGMLKTLKYILSEKGYDVVTLTSGAEAIDLITKRHFDLALLDIKMPEMNGVEVLKEIKRLSPDTAIMMITAYTMHKLVEEAKQEGAKVILSKPLDLDRVISLTDQLKDTRRSLDEGDISQPRELLAILQEKERELREKSLLIKELKKALADIRENPAELFEHEKRKRQSREVHKILKPKQLELFTILKEGEKNYHQLFAAVCSKQLDIRDLHALRLQVSRLNSKLLKETTFRIVRKRRNKTLYLSVGSDEQPT